MKQRRNTVAKRRILSLIAESDVALSHAEIQSCLKDVCDRVTIYRVLERLISEGAIHKVVSIEGVVKYALCDECSSRKHAHNHIHFNCINCQTISCIKDVEPQFSLPSQYKVLEVNFIVSGICPACHKETEALSMNERSHHHAGEASTEE